MLSSLSLCQLEFDTLRGQDAPQTVGSGPSGSSTSRAHQMVVEGKRRRRNVAALEDDDDDYDGEGGSDYQDLPRQVRKDLEENFSSDDPEDDEDDDDQQDIMERNENTAAAAATAANNIPQSISNLNAIASTSSKPHPHPSDPTREETPSFVVPVLETEETAGLDSAQHDDSTSTSLRAEDENTNDSTRLQLENEGNETDVAVPGAQSEPTPELSSEQRIKQLEEKVEKLNALRLVDAASISRSSLILSSQENFSLYIYTYLI